MRHRILKCFYCSWEYWERMHLSRNSWRTWRVTVAIDVSMSLPASGTCRWPDTLRFTLVIWRWTQFRKKSFMTRVRAQFIKRTWNKLPWSKYKWLPVHLCPLRDRERDLDMWYFYISKSGVSRFFPFVYLECASRFSNVFIARGSRVW